MAFHIGTSGWSYSHWRGTFYPAKLPQARWLEFYTFQFATVELNNSFYHLPAETTWEGWRARTPPEFRFAVKVSRLITHLKKLRGVEEPLANFMERAMLLKEKLGPLLYQLPPSLHASPSLLEDFLRLLPPGLQHTFEFRHPSWFAEEVLVLLRRYGAGFCIYHMPEQTTPVVATAPWAYVRFHGTDRLYGGSYPEEELRGWAERIRDLEVEDTYIYFNNDIHGFAVANAVTLKEMLS